MATRVPKIVYGRANRLKISLPDQDLSAKSVHARFLSVETETLTNEVKLTNGSGVDMTEAEDGLLALDFTVDQASTWPINTSVRLYLAVFNSDDSMFAEGELTYRISP